MPLTFPLLQFHIPVLDLLWQEGIPDSLCNITDTVCVEPQPKQSNFSDTYTHKIVSVSVMP